MIPLAILGGTFDPIHYGHLRLADDVATALAPIEVRLVPAADPPHRQPTRASADDRLAMLRLALAEFPRLAVDTRELTRGGKSFTVDTLADLRKEDGERSLALIVGADAFHGFPKWHRWKTLFELAHVIVVPRPGVDLVKAMPPLLLAEWRRRKTDNPTTLREQSGGSIYVQPVSANPISSSAIRAALNRRDEKPVELAGLLPAPVLAYIQARQLYGHEPHAG